MRGAYESFRRVYGADDRNTLATGRNYAAVLRKLGWFEQAERMYLEVLATSRRTLGADHLSTLGAINNYAMCLADLGRFDEAEGFHREAHAGLVERFGAANQYAVASAHNLAECVRDAGRPEEAVELARANLAIAIDGLGATHWRVGVVRGGLAKSLLASGQTALAGAQLAEAARVLEADPRGQPHLDEVRRLQAAVSDDGTALGSSGDP